MKDHESVCLEPAGRACRVIAKIFGHPGCKQIRAL